MLWESFLVQDKMTRYCILQKNIWILKRFVSALDNVIKGIESGNKITLVCTEKDPIECHRHKKIDTLTFKV